MAGNRIARTPSVFLYESPMVADPGGLSLLVRHEMEAATPRPWTDARLVEVPVCYDLEFALDLEALAARAGLERFEVVARHTASDYHVFMLGFTPGFAYMGTVDASLATPRLSTPRTRVPAGSVGIAGNQTGIYPSDTPGGWNLIGRTPLRCWTPDADEPTLFRPGDRVRFTAIDRREFERLATTGSR